MIEQPSTIQQPPTEREQEQQKRFETNKKRIFEVLAQSGVEEVVIAYSGEGDEGSFEDPEFYPDLDRKGKKVFLEQARGDIPTPLATAVEEFTSDLLEDQYGGWGDGEGSQGTVTWNVKDGKIHVSHGEPAWEYREAEF